MAKLQFLWTGIPCIYYGDELDIDGYTHHDSGFRYKMPWDEEAKRKEGRHFKTYQKLNGLRQNERAFSEGGRKVLFANGKILAVSRFMGDNIYLGVISMEDEDMIIHIPVKNVGALEPYGSVDELGTAFEGKSLEDGNYELVVPARSSFIMKMRTL